MSNIVDDAYILEAGERLLIGADIKGPDNPLEVASGVLPPKVLEQSIGQHTLGSLLADADACTSEPTTPTPQG